MHTVYTEKGMDLSSADLDQLREKGISEEELKTQLRVFQNGVASVQLERCCSLGDGIERLSDEEQAEAIHEYEAASSERIMRFVPASGAASRMFKFLHAIADGNNADEAGEVFFRNLEKMPFYPELEQCANDIGIDLKKASKSEIAGLILSDHGLGYGRFPKGLIPFHRLNYGGVRTAFEEQLVEASMQAGANSNSVLIHFTVPEDHKKRIAEFLEEKGESIEKELETAIEIGYSVQRPHTDIVAVDLNNEPVRTPQGNLLFRPGGHGALLENLDELDADIVFIKNIDNVVTDSRKGDSVRWKKILGGKLVQVKDDIHGFLRELEAGDHQNLDEIERYCRQVLHIDLPELSSAAPDKRAEILREMLDRPIRICGMVENEGEPGGGPFWVRDNSGRLSKQIIEGAQIDTDNEEQRLILQASTHFNPVDIACSITNHKGEHYQLKKFRDETARFIAGKSYEGKEIKAQELPGLWNGAMARWNTIFVEVPASTFNPVKTVNDLLRPAHQD